MTTCLCTLSPTVTFLIFLIHIFLNFHSLDTQYNVCSVAILCHVLCLLMCMWDNEEEESQFLPSENYLLKEVRELNKEIQSKMTRGMTEEFRCALGTDEDVWG